MSGQTAETQAGIEASRGNISRDGKGSKLSTLTKRLRTGFGMGGIATLWIFSGNWVFSLGFAMQALLAQLEYYRMAMVKGVFLALFFCFSPFCT